MDTGGILKNVSDYERLVRTGVGWHGYRRNTEECIRLCRMGQDWCRLAWIQEEY